MAELENPSAGKFGPPPENERRERVRLDGSPKKPKSLWPLVLMVAALALQYFLDSLRGWGADVAILLLAIAGYVAEFVFYRQEQAANGGPNPYTPPTHITR